VIFSGSQNTHPSIFDFAAAFESLLFTDFIEVPLIAGSFLVPENKHCHLGVDFLLKSYLLLVYDCHL
jgi:hypothetical protein